MASCRRLLLYQFAGWRMSDRVAPKMRFVVPQLKNGEGLADDLAGILNKHSVDNELNTPDFILAAYLVDVLDGMKFLNHCKSEWEKPV